MWGVLLDQARPPPLGFFVCRKERLDSKFLQGDISRSAKRHHCAEQTQLDVLLLDVNGQEQIAGTDSSRSAFAHKRTSVLTVNGRVDR